MPFTILGVLGYFDALKVKEARTEVLLLLAIFMGIVIPYSAWYDPTGGLSFGPRFVVPAIPFLLLPAGYIVEQARGVRLLAVYGVFAAGAVINGMAAFVTAVPPSTGFDASPFVDYIVPSFAAGNLDSLWASYLGHEWYLGAALILSLGVCLPVIWVERLRGRESTSGRIRAEGPQGNVSSVRRAGFEPARVALSSRGLGSHYPNHWINAAREDPRTETV